MIYGIVASQSVKRSIVAVLNAIIESDGPVLTFGDVTFELAPANTAEIIEMVFGGLAEGNRIPPDEGFYTLNPNMQMHGKFSRALDIGANEYVVLEYSQSLGGDGENWVDIGTGYEAVEGAPGEFLMGDSRYASRGISYQLWESYTTYYRASMYAQDGTLLEATDPVAFIFYADEAKSPGFNVVRGYIDDVFSAMQMADGAELYGFHDWNNHSIFWNQDPSIGPNPMVYDAALQRVRPTATAGISASTTAFSSGPNWGEILVRAKLYCPPSTPGLGAGSGIVFKNNAGTEIFRWVWEGNKMKTITPVQTDEYTVPGGTLSLNVEMRLVQGSFAVNNWVVADNYEVIWEGNSPSINPAVDLTTSILITVFGPQGAAVDSWEHVKFRASILGFDPGQDN